LPAKSWENILATRKDHFGSEVVLDEQQRDSIANYLVSNAADKSSAKIGNKIARSLGGAAPGRIVEIPYIIKKHRKVGQALFSRKSVGSMANCIACHPGASNARFDDDDVMVPQE